MSSKDEDGMANSPVKFCTNCTNLSIPIIAFKLYMYVISYRQSTEKLSQCSLQTRERERERGKRETEEERELTSLRERERERDVNQSQRCFSLRERERERGGERDPMTIPPA